MLRVQNKNRFCWADQSVCLTDAVGRLLQLLTLLCTNLRDLRCFTLRAVTALMLTAAAMAGHASALDVAPDANWPITASPQSIFLYEDTDASKSLQDIVALDNEQPHRFEPLDSVSVPSASRSAWWVKVDIVNSGQRATDLRLVISASLRGRIDYYVHRDAKWHHSVAGSAVPMSEQASDTARKQALPFSIYPGQQITVFARVASAGRLSIQPILYSQQAYDQAERQTVMLDGILLGGLLMLAWGALLIAIMSRSRSFLLMAVLCTTITLYEASLRGYAKAYLWPEATDWALRSPAFLGFSALALTLSFILAIAHLERIRVPGRPLIVMVIVAEAGAATLGLSGHLYLVTKIAPLAMALYALCAISSAIFLLKRSAPSSRVMIVAGTFIALHTALRISESTNTLPQFIIDLGLGSPGDNPAMALTRLALNTAVLTAWVTIIARQRKEANNELTRMRERETERLKEQVAIQTEALNRSLQYANEENRRKVELLSYVSHDLRAPLATIVGYARLLATDTDANQQAHAGVIERSAHYQLSLIDEIMDYAKNELTPLHIDSQPISLPGLLDDVARHGKSLSEQHNNRLEIHAATPLPATVKTDPKRLRQVLLNLISNAAKFTQNGHIRLTVAAHDNAGQATLTFQVSDTGTGIEPEAQDLIFDAFSQLDARPGSAGLGLHIAKRIVEGLSGSITLKSHPGAGSCFSVAVPVDFMAGAVQVDDIVFAPARHNDSAAFCHVDDAPPVELRIDLAKYARQGQLSDIESWLDQQSALHWPSYASFFNALQQAVHALDFDTIEHLALAKTK